MRRFGRIDADTKLDRYYSPKPPIRWLVDRLSDVETIAEPCAGRGDMIEVFEADGYSTISGDLDPESPYPTIDATSTFALEWYRDADAIATNPPYSAEAGSAFDVLSNLIRLDVPIWLLTRLSFLEPPKYADRRQCFTDDAGVLRPDQVHVLTRIHYEGPALDEKRSNTQTSCWIGWNLDETRKTVVDWTCSLEEYRDGS